MFENVLDETKPGQPLDPGQLNLPAENSPAENPDENKIDGAPSADGVIPKIHGHVAKARDAALSFIKRGRGRPRSDGQPKKGDTVSETPIMDAPKIPQPIRPADNDLGNSPTVEALDGQIIEVTAKVTILGAADAGRKAIELYGIKGGLTKIELAPYIDPLKITEEEKEAIYKLIKFFVKKYQVTIEYLPEILAALMVVGIGARFGMTAFAIRGLIAEKKGEKSLAE